MSALVAGEFHPHLYRGRPRPNVALLSSVMNNRTFPALTEDAQRYMPDHEAVYRALKDQEFPVHGHRRVENEWPFSSDMVTAGMGTQANASITSSVYTMSGASARAAYLNDVATGVVEGETYIYSIRFTPDQSGTFTLEAKDGDFGASNITAVSKEVVAGEMIRLSLPVTIPSSPDGDLGIAFFFAEDGSVTPYTATVHHQQMENSTGRADTTTPSEEVSTGVGTGSELVTNGDFDAGVEDWDTESNAVITWNSGAQNATVSATGANRITSQTESLVVGKTYGFSIIANSDIGAGGTRIRVGTTLGGFEYLDFTPTASPATYRGVFIATATTAYISFLPNPGVEEIIVDSASLKPIDHGWNVDGVKNFRYENPFTVTDNVVSDSGTSTPITVGGDNVYAPAGYTGEGEVTEISGYSGDLTTSPAFSNLTSSSKNAVGLTGAPSGAWTFTDSSAAAALYIQRNTTIISGSDVYYLLTRVAYDASPSVYPSIALQLAGGTALTEEIIFDPSNGTYNERQTGGDIGGVWRTGGFWNILLTITDNASGNNSARSYLVPAFNTDGSTTQAVAAQGSTVFASCELYKTNYSLTPILTTGGTPATRPATTGATSPLSLFSDAQGAFECKVTPWFGTNTSAYQGIMTPLSSTAVRGVFFSSAAGQILDIWDGTTNANISSCYAYGEQITIKVRWGNGTMQLSVIRADGTVQLSDEEAYDGSFNPSGAITFFKSLSLMASIMDVKFYRRDLGLPYLTA